MPSRTIRTAYIEFLGLTQKVEERATLPLLDPLENAILTKIAVAGYTGARMSVRDMMFGCVQAAPATVHKRLVSLREKGWIEMRDTSDARRKQLALTEQALRHFDKLSRCMLKVRASH